MWRWRWELLDARVIDEKFVRRAAFSTNRDTHFQEWDYMIEVPGPSGDVKRLVIREKTYKLRLPIIGKTVPVLVNRKRTKAAFDLKDPRIDAVGHLKSKEKARKARDEARFKEKLDR